MTITPVEHRLGSATITVTVSDGSLSASDSFTLNVTASPAQTWWFQKFGTTDLTASPHAATADSDNDGGSNLLEYSQGSDPLVPDSAVWLPGTALDGNVFRFTYRKSGGDLTYVVQTNTAPDAFTWLPVASQEIDNGNGTYSIQSALSGTPAFFRLKINAP